ncbi:MAG: ATP-binding protein [Burkholderiales bacterium]
MREFDPGRTVSCTPGRTSSGTGIPGRILRRLGVPRQACLRLNLVVEELFTNTVKHGHRGDCDAPIWVEVSRAGDSVLLIYEDKAPPFNPFSKLLEQPPPDTTISMRKIGGLGVLLTRQLAASRDYAYLFGRNRIRLVLGTA